MTRKPTRQTDLLHLVTDTHDRPDQAEQPTLYDALDGLADEVRHVHAYVSDHPAAGRLESVADRLEKYAAAAGPLCPVCGSEGWHGVITEPNERPRHVCDECCHRVEL
jgi:hypothetical protein